MLSYANLREKILILMLLSVTTYLNIANYRCRKFLEKSSKLINFRSIYTESLTKHLYLSKIFTQSMLEALISSKTRVKLLLKFFLNSKSEGYLRGLEQEFGESTNSIRIELNRFEKAGMLKTESSGNKKFFKANTEHPLFQEVHNILRKYIGVDTIIEKVINRLGNVEQVYLVGSLSKGIDHKIIDLIIFGDVDKEYLVRLIDRVEEHLSRKIRYLTYSMAEHDEILKVYPDGLLLWSRKQDGDGK